MENPTTPIEQLLVFPGIGIKTAAMLCLLGHRKSLPASYFGYDVDKGRRNVVPTVLCEGLAAWERESWRTKNPTLRPTDKLLEILNRTHPTR